MKNRLEALSPRRPVAAVALAMFALLVAGYAQSCLARQPSQVTFRSAEEAGQALFSAVQTRNERAVKETLGAGDELVSSHDAAQDKLDRERFVQKYQEMHRLVREPDGITILYIGAENWPFPVPLVSQKGRWRFDPDGGRKEILFRQIGENEIAAMDTCRALVVAQRQPDGREAVGGMIGALLAAARSDKKGALLHGYFFRVVPAPGSNSPAGAKSDVRDSRAAGGFAVAAFPAAYGSSGVMSFVINRDGVLYEKDLGPDTLRLARAMTEYRPDATWTPAETEP
jgi:hypothetical protein